MTLPGRDAGEVDALVTDRYLDALLAGQADLALAPGPRRERALDVAVRAASRRLASDLPRFHPSFRFEERLALRLAEAAAAMRLPLAAGSESEITRIPATPRFDPLGVLPDDERPDGRGDSSADLWRGAVRGAVAASALSLAGAAWYAWRHRPATSSPMARAARAAHAGSSHVSSRRAIGRPGRA